MPPMHMRLGRPPLHDLPLEQFLLPDDNTPSPHRVIKRPLSPGGSSRRSPAKRRILAVDGACSPQKSSENHDPSSPRTRRSSRRLSAALKGADSPSKKLDFSRLSVSMAADEDMEQEAMVDGPPQPIASVLAPSPELRLNNGNSLGSSATPHVHVTTFDAHISRTHVVGPVVGQPSIEPLATDPTPHETAAPDRQSPHYPGFDVYRDTCITENSTECSSQDMDVDICGSADDSQLDLVAMRREAEKENIQPRRARGSMGPPAMPGEVAWAKAGLLPPTAHRKLQDVRGRPRSQRGSMA
ncbi:uncharacterized protein C8Q71DRAFT_731263 [Rhodofomes roseus]|uniref:Uncharacterized protein n=1 Tax=Rhodofomes roseus TaxID=34475 RepID=A0A4Y9Z6C1_9APHY|nr:uncharacterized protein C8Q71DRAFT_731263 [Rhodofomes roseus]KAH9844082.1 hypothetical protein C8Q71DRAFT_731263 [Rhodofomes roseus]TFY69408.1 hypothetical protein EVJ58_g431 [Rhodofomes roseus]